MESFDTSREKVIKASRDILKFSKAAIYSIHRNDMKQADSNLKKAGEVMAKLESFTKDPNLAAGAYNNALEEFVEASAYYNFIRENKLLTAKQLNVSTEIYLS